MADTRSTPPLPVHELKTWPDPFEDVWQGRKLHEIRRADRPYQVADWLLLEEWDPATRRYTGRRIRAQVTCITRGGEWGLPEAICVMSIRAISRWEDHALVI